MARVTPMMEQYGKIKAEHQDAILLFRMGDFYELFFDDAKVASKVLGIALTSLRPIPVEPGPEHAVLLFRIFQESLQNIVQHARAEPGRCHHH